MLASRNESLDPDQKRFVSLKSTSPEHAEIHSEVHVSAIPKYWLAKSVRVKLARQNIVIKIYTGLTPLDGRVLSLGSSTWSERRP